MANEVLFLWCLQVKVGQKIHLTKAPLLHRWSRHQQPSHGFPRFFIHFENKIYCSVTENFINNVHLAWIDSTSC